MLKLFLKAMFFLALAVSYSWCKDKVVITGTITDSVSSSPVQGLRVVSWPVPYGQYAKETRTDASGKYSITNDSAGIVGLGGEYSVQTSFPNAYQYKAVGVNVTIGANRSDGVADTITVNLNVGHHTPPPDTLFIKGRVTDTSSVPIANAQVKCIISVNSILYPVTYGYDTLQFTTDADGFYSWRGQNIYAMTSGSFTLPCPTGFDPAKNKTTGTGTLKPKVASTADTTHASLFDGNLDSIIVTDFKLIPGGTNIHSPYKAVNVSFTQNPVNVSIYSIDGRLVGKIDNVKIEALDNMLSSLNLFRSKVMLAEWSQNGVKCSKRIMNLTKNNK
jgi:hypothetical protein